MFDELLEGKFDGIVVLIPNDVTEKGIKTVVHEYPNLDRRFIEEFGKFPPTFSTQFIIHGFDLVNKRIQLEHSLDSGGIKNFVHPVYGNVNVKVSGKYRVTYDQKEEGRFVFDVKLDTSEENITLRVKGDDDSEASASIKANDLISSISNSFIKKYQLPSSYFSIISASDKLLDVSDTLLNELNKIVSSVIISDGLLSIFSPIIELSERANRFYSIFNRTKYLIDRFPTAIVKGLSSLLPATLYSGQDEASASVVSSVINSFLNQLSDIPESPEYGFSLWEALLTFGDEDVIKDSITQRRVEISSNINALNSFIKIYALARYLESIAYIEIRTEDDLIKIKEESYDNFKEIITIQKNEFVDDNIRRSSWDLFVSVTNVLDGKSPNLWKIKEIENDRINIGVLAYQLYEDLDLARDLIRLNKSKNCTRMLGSVKILDR